jgi:translation initiation factor 1
VYSTDPGWVPPCETCGQPPDLCRCKEGAAPPPPSAQTVIVRLERKGRGGKTVTVVEGIQGPPERIAEAARRLKAACGTGGTAKEGSVELQGDHRDRAAKTLEAEGYKVKRSGG